MAASLIAAGLLAEAGGSSVRTLAPIVEREVRVRNRHFLILDVLILSLLPALALSLRLDGWSWWPRYASGLALFTALSLVIKLAAIYSFDLYTRYWPCATMDDLVQIVIAVAVSTVVTAALCTMTHPTLAIYGAALPRSVPLIDGLLTLIAVGGLRSSARILACRNHRRIEQALGQRARPEQGRRVLVMGAGEAGRLIVREMFTNPQLRLEPVGFVDDDPNKLGTRIHGLPVLGTREDIPALVREHGVQQVIIAMPRAPGTVVRRVRAICEGAGVTARTIPGLYEILSGRVKVSQIRDVTIEDLLRREPVVIDQAEVDAYLRETTVLVTGAGGSIGSELCRQIAAHSPQRLILLGHGEHSIFTIQMELRQAFPALTLHSVIADVRDEARLNRVMDTYRPTVVFHAAAHKHVPLMEANVAEAITNNVLGTKRLIQAAERCEVRRFVLISTDKAVNPVSVMGACKRIGEMLVQEAARRNGSIFVAVRFGNVLGSRGSVVDVFRRQITAGGPLTVTHPEMRRYFMTIPEAVQLVLQAAALGQGGEIFVLDMGEPVRIVDLARDLIELSGLIPGCEVGITFCGARPGEKMCEELFSQEENCTPTRHSKILVVRRAPAIAGEKLQQAIRELEWLVERAGEDILRAKLQEIVPEYRPMETVREGALQAGLSETVLRYRPAGPRALSTLQALPRHLSSPRLHDRLPSLGAER